jgi:AbrB family looped-hinge helix DNA binding protein
MRMSGATARVQAKGQVTIPREIRRKLNLKKGDMVIFEEIEGGVIVKPASVVDDDTLRGEVSAIIQRIRARFADHSPEEIEALVNEAILSVRGKNP